MWRIERLCLAIIYLKQLLTINVSWLKHNRNVNVGSSNKSYTNEKHFYTIMFIEKPQIVKNLIFFLQASSQAHLTIETMSLSYFELCSDKFVILRNQSCERKLSFGNVILTMIHNRYTIFNGYTSLASSQDTISSQATFVLHTHLFLH